MAARAELQLEIAHEIEVAAKAGTLAETVARPRQHDAIGIVEGACCFQARCHGLASSASGSMRG